MVSLTLLLLNMFYSGLEFHIYKKSGKNVVSCCLLKTCRLKLALSPNSSVVNLTNTEFAATHTEIMTVLRGSVKNVTCLTLRKIIKIVKSTLLLPVLV